MKELETALAVVERMEEKGLVTVDSQLRERVEKLGGEFRIASEIGKGTRVLLRIGARGGG